MWHAFIHLAMAILINGAIDALSDLRIFVLLRGKQYSTRKVIISSNLIIFFIAIRDQENDFPVKSNNPLTKLINSLTICKVSLKQTSIVMAL